MRKRNNNRSIHLPSLYFFQSLQYPYFSIHITLHLISATVPTVNNATTSDNIVQKHYPLMHREKIHVAWY